MIYVITGPPGAGKTSLSKALLATVEFGLHIPVDDLRGWVKSGMSDSVPWTEETERQFQIAERATCAVARTYDQAGFTIVIDHCRNTPRLEALIQAEFEGYEVRRVLLLPELAINLDRNANRTDKTFDPLILTDTIKFTHEAYHGNTPSGWMVVDNTAKSIGETVNLVTSL